MSPVLESFMHAMMWKAGVVIVLCGVGATVLRTLTRLLERSATSAMRARRDAEKSKSHHIDSNEADTADGPPCPSCNGAMILRKARRGSRAGQEFWGCSLFPKCRGTRPL